MNDQPRNEFSNEKFLKWAKSYENEDKINFTEEEHAYRRGYSQGFAAACQRLDVTIQEVNLWADSKDATCPPGTPMEGTYLPGVIKKY